MGGSALSLSILAEVRNPDSSQGVTAVHVEVQVLGILISTQIGEDAARPVLARDLAGDLTDNGEDFVQNDLVGTSEIDQRGDVPLRNDDDVHWPERPRVAKREHLVGLRDNVHRCPATERLIAIEVLAHGMCRSGAPFTRAGTRSGSDARPPARSRRAGW